MFRIYNDNHPQIAAKPGQHQEKDFVSILWNMKESVHYELLPENQTITSAIYSQELDHLKAACSTEASSLT